MADRTWGIHGRVYGLPRDLLGVARCAILVHQSGMLCRPTGLRSPQQSAGNHENELTTIDVATHSSRVIVGKHHSWISNENELGSAKSTHDGTSILGLNAWGTSNKAWQVIPVTYVCDLAHSMGNRVDSRVQPFFSFNTRPDR
jgi:hypothetical protein